MIPDVNVLVAAFRNEHTHHGIAKAWLSGAREAASIGAATLVLLPVVVAGFLRLVTNRRIFNDPDPMEDAVEFIDVLIESPGVALRVADNDWPLLRSKLLSQRLAGNLVSDASIASMVQALSEHLITFDRDFKKLLPARDFTLLKRAK